MYIKKRRKKEETRERQQTMTTDVSGLAVGSVGRRSSAFLTVLRQKDASSLPKSTEQ